jgi:hypothetical protein
VIPFFAAAKLLAFIPGGNLLKGTTGKLILIGLAIAAIIFLVWRYNEHIRAEVYNRIYQEQAEQHLKEQKEEFERSQRIFKEAQDATLRLSRENEKRARDIERLRSQVRSSAPEDDGPVAPVLKNALESIRVIEAGTPPPEKTLGEKVGDTVKGAVDSSVDTGNKAIDEWRRKLDK